MDSDAQVPTSRLRRDLGVLESYAALVGILVGAGIFKVTGDASRETGAGVIFGYVALAPAILATSVAYMVFLSTPLGREPGGEYLHVARTFSSKSLGFQAAWLKLLAYTGASAYLATALSEYLLQIPGHLGWAPEGFDPSRWVTPFAVVALCFFTGIHVLGVKWFGRIQVAMCAALGVSIFVLVIPGLFHLEPSHFSDPFPRGSRGFLAALPPLFFAYAGFESLAHTGGEVEDSTTTLPRVFLRGIVASTVVFLAMSIVAFGVLPVAELETSQAPMADVAAVYLPGWGAALVAVGGVFAAATSVNASLFVPARMGVMMSEEKLVPRLFGHVHPSTGTPVIGLVGTLALTLALLFMGELGTVLSLAVSGLLCVYTLHSLALLRLPGLRPDLMEASTTKIPILVQRLAGVFSILFMGALLWIRFAADAGTVADGFRIGDGAGGTRLRSVTTTELLVLWILVGALLCRFGRSARA